MIGLSFRVMREVSRFSKRHPIVAFAMLMIAMYGMETSKKNKAHSGD